MDQFSGQSLLSPLQGNDLGYQMGDPIGESEFLVMPRLVELETLHGHAIIIHCGGAQCELEDSKGILYERLFADTVASNLGAVENDPSSGDGTSRFSLRGR